MKTLTIGRGASCDLVLDDESVSRKHAHAWQDGDGHVWLEDADSRNGLFLNRNRQWQKARRITLCVGDRVRLGDSEVRLERLSGLFTSKANVVLRPARYPSEAARRIGAMSDDAETAMNKPRRNPVTGKIEDIES